MKISFKQGEMHVNTISINMHKYASKKFKVSALSTSISAVNAHCSKHSFKVYVFQNQYYTSTGMNRKDSMEKIEINKKYIKVKIIPSTTHFL